MTNLVARRFAITQLAANTGESFIEESADEIGLQLAGFGLLHFLFDGIQLVEAHVLLDQCVATENLTQMLGVQRPIDDLALPCTHFRGVAVTNSFDQQILKRYVVERLAEDIEHLAAQSLLFDFQLLEQFLEYFTFAGLIGDDVPQVANLILANTVNT